MTFRRILAVVALVCALVVPAGAQNFTDLEPVGIIVDQPGDLPPVVDSPVRIRVRVTNHGPDAYDGTTLAKARRYPSLQGGRLSITIDIDEPSKPDPDVIVAFNPGFVLTDSFAVNIAVNDTVTLDFGLTSFAPSRAGLHGISALTTPGGGNIDPVASNDLLHSFFVALPITPALGWWALGTLMALVLVVARRRMRHRGANAGARPA